MTECLNSRNELTRKLIKYINIVNDLKEQPLELDLEDLDFYELWEQYLIVLGIEREYFAVYLQDWLDKKFSRNEIYDKNEMYDYMVECDLFNPSLVYIGIFTVLSEEAKKFEQNIKNLDKEIIEIENSLKEPRSWVLENDLRQDLRDVSNERYVESQKLSRIRKLAEVCDEGLSKVNEEANS